MQSQKEIKLLEKSIDFIANFPDATNTDLPDDLLHAWRMEAFTQDPYATPNSLQKLIFMFIYRINEKADKAKDIPLENFNFFRAFHNFQVILSAVWISRTTGYPLHPIPLFDLHIYSPSAPPFPTQECLLNTYHRLIADATNISDN